MPEAPRVKLLQIGQLRLESKEHYHRIIENPGSGGRPSQAATGHDRTIPPPGNPQRIFLDMYIRLAVHTEDGICDRNDCGAEPPRDLEPAGLVPTVGRGDRAGNFACRRQPCPSTRACCVRPGSWNPRWTRSDFLSSEAGTASGSGRVALPIRRFWSAYVDALERYLGHMESTPTKKRQGEKDNRSPSTHRVRPTRRVRRDRGKWMLVCARELHHSPERVWQALTDQAQLRQWAPSAWP